ncbi:hypothetical protein ACEPAG_5197 [Sanghuangporus baumii]
MGIIVSWINTAWAIADPQLIANNDHEDHIIPSSPLTANSDRHTTHLDFVASGDTRPIPPTSHANQQSLSALKEQTSSLATSIPSLDSPAPLSAPPGAGASSAFFIPSTVGAVDNRQHLFVSSDYNERPPVVPMAESLPLPIASGAASSSSAPGSPPLSSTHGLRIDVAAANDPTMDHEMVDASYVAATGQPDNNDDLCFDDEGLSALEKIYLFARSNASFHRVFISRSLLSFLPDVPPNEAVEYVIPLMNCLAMDEDEAVKEALVENLVSAIWWFLTHCQLSDHEVPEGAEPPEVPLLNVQSFTPLLGTLLLNSGANVNAPARHCVVNLLRRVREAGSDEAGFLGPKERKLLEHELIQHVVIGMAHLDVDSPAEGSEGSNPPQNQFTATEHLDTSSGEPDNTMSPPPSAADDEVLLSTLSSSVHALATSQFLAQEDPSTPTVAAIAACIQRPPSPIPTIHPMVAIPEYEPEFAHIISRPVPDESSDPEDTRDRGSPMTGVTSLPAWATEPLQNLQNETAFLERGEQKVPQTQVPAPRPENLSQSNVPAITGENDQGETERGDANSDSNEDQVAIGKLSSMSLIAAVTASGPLDQGYQSAFLKEIERAGRDPIYWVRREATFALGALAKVVPEELLFTSLLPLFDFFCGDSIWNVRQSVLFALPSILSRLPPGLRRIHALQTIQKMAIDSSPQVRTGVLEILGEVIYSFHEDDKGPPEEIVRLFIGEEGHDWHSPDSPVLENYSSYQTHSPWADSVFRSRFPDMTNDLSIANRSISAPSPSPINPIPDSDPTRPLICAFNLPAVALTLGQARWQDLRGLYIFLARTGASKVRQTLAASIGEIARIVGPEHSRRDLLYRWWDFVRGRDSSVQTKALEALEVFLQVLDPVDRPRIIGSLEEIWDNHLRGWREREILARSFDRLAPFFTSDGKALRSLLRRALRDPAAAVRNAAIEAFPQIYASILSLPIPLSLVVEEVSSLVHDDSFKKRLTYVECSRSLIATSPYYERFMDENFWHSVVFLSADKIPDVRIALSRLLSIVCDKILAKQHTLPGNVLDIIRNLSEDAVGDVRAFVSHLLPPNLGPPTELAFGHASESGRSMATFSRPPPRREPKTLVSGMNDMTITDYHRQMEQAG